MNEQMVRISRLVLAEERIRELEAELRQLKAPSGALALQNTCGDCSVYHGIGHAQGLKADLQRVGIERADALLYGGQQRARAEKAEARAAELELSWKRERAALEDAHAQRDFYKARAAELERIQANMIWNEEAREREAE